MDWFRWWHGACTDPKFQMVARDCKVPVAAIIGLWACLLEKASEGDSRGAIDSLDMDVLAFMTGLDDVVTPCNAMKHRGLLHVTDGMWSVTNWEKRQPKRERIDDSTERVRKYRESKKQALTVGKNHETPSNADVTPGNAQIREEEIREEIIGVSAKPPKNTGSRLPESWKLPKDLGEWAMAEIPGASVEAIRLEAAKFADYWHGIAGARGKKADWPGTWRNWMRNADMAKSARASSASDKPSWLHAGAI